MTALLHSGVLLSSALGFSLQLILARLLLPETGGLPVVWVACTFFFQTTVIFSYLYGEWITRLPVLRQFFVHATLFILAAASFLPLQPEVSPEIWHYGLIFGVVTSLGLAASLPFFLLASHTVIFAAWLRQIRPSSNPYRLFASANTGSLAALVLYPFAFEPLADLPGQMFWWSLGFVMISLLLGFLGVTLLRSNVQPPGARDSTPTISRSTACGKDILSIMVTSALSSIIFLSATSYFSIVLFPVSLLWVLPFGMYLLAWIIAFAGPPKVSYQQRLLSLLPFVFLNLIPMPSAFLIALNTLLVGAICLGLHTRIASLQGRFSHPATYYVIISLGGMLGNIGIILLSHLVSSATIYPLALFASTLAIPLTTLFPWVKKSQSWQHRLPLPGAIVALGCIYLGIASASDESGSELWRKTDLLGSLRVTECPETHTRRLLLNEVIQGQENALTPNYGYYGWLRDLRKHMFEATQPVAWAGLGMGVGTIAIAALPGDRMDFFEINPSVVFAAQQYFSYLNNSPAELRIETGDARKLLEESTQVYDIIVGDAYAGGSIPQHMMTREFFQLCSDRLSPKGILVIHVSHRALKQLGDVVTTIGESLGFSPWLLEVKSDHQSLEAVWILLVRPVNLPAYSSHLRQLGCQPASGNGVIWTDQFSPVWKAW